MIQVLLFLLITWMMLAQFFSFALFVAVWYVFRYSGYELIILAVLVDGYYGAFFSLPLLSLGTTAFVFFVNFIKPSLLMYTERNEMVS
jgi:hypothetical protein